MLQSIGRGLRWAAVWVGLRLLAAVLLSVPVLAVTFFWPFYLSTWIAVQVGVQQESVAWWVVGACCEAPWLAWSVPRVVQWWRR